jgi:cellulose synthase/poly-beta-1,6-N-acetylglucosamine synthase-like glycosyltransferase
MEAVQTQHRGVGEADQGQYDQAEDVAFVTGAAFALRRDTLQRVGYLDEHFFPGYYEDTDYCIRVREAGLRIRYVPAATVIHHVSTSTRQNWVRMRFYYYRNRMILALKHTPIERFASGFVPAERERLDAASPGELYAARVALSELLARWPDLAGEIREPLPAQSAEQVSYALRSLLDFVVWRQDAGPDLGPILPSLGQARRTRRGVLQALLPAIEDMETVWQIRRKPRPGMSAAMLGTAWRLLTIGAYRVLFGRQTRFNRLVARALGALTAHAWDGASAMGLLADQYGDVATRIAELGGRLARLERGAAPGEARDE